MFGLASSCTETRVLQCSKLSHVTVSHVRCNSYHKGLCGAFVMLLVFLLFINFNEDTVARWGRASSLGREEPGQYSLNPIVAVSSGGLPSKCFTCN